MRRRRHNRSVSPSKALLRRLMQPGSRRSKQIRRGRQNTITDPKRIVPVTSSANFKGGRLEHVLPGYSIQVMELDLNRRYCLYLERRYLTSSSVSRSKVFC